MEPIFQNLKKHAKTVNFGENQNSEFNFLDFFEIHFFFKLPVLV